MRDTRFIFVEGIMGAGKSTTAFYLTEQLKKNGFPARFMAEGPTLDEPQHPLRIATKFPHPQGIWLDLTAEEFIEFSLHTWREFVQEAQPSEIVTICDGLLFHGNMTDLLLMNVMPDRLHQYVIQIIEILQPLNPTIIYYYHADIEKAIHVVSDERGQQWETYQVNWKMASPFAIQQSLHGIEGLIQLYKMYRGICDDIFAQLQLPKLSICNEGRWEMYYRDIHSFLQLPQLALE